MNDEGLGHLASLSNLRSLRIDRTLTTDDSLRTVAKLPALEEISLDDATTEKGIGWLADPPLLDAVRRASRWVSRYLRLSTASRNPAPVSAFVGGFC